MLRTCSVMPSSSPTAFGTNSDMGWAILHSFMSMLPYLASSHASLRMTEASSKTAEAASNSIDSNFMGLPFGRELGNSHRSLTGNPAHHAIGA